MHQSKSSSPSALKQLDQRRDSLGYVYENALEPDIYGNYKQGHPETEEEKQKKLQKQRLKQKKMLEAMDVSESLKYYKE